MNVKLIVSATAAALLAVSTASFGQSSTSGRPAGSSGSNTGGTPPAMTGGSSNGSSATGTSSGSMSGSSATGATASRCAALTGLEKDRCLKEEGAATDATNSSNMRPEGSSGSNTGGVSPRMGGSSSGGTTTR